MRLISAADREPNFNLGILNLLFPWDSTLLSDSELLDDSSSEEDGIVMLRFLSLACLGSKKFKHKL
jgi:hypothetical protein